MSAASVAEAISLGRKRKDGSRMTTSVKADTRNWRKATNLYKKGEMPCVGQHVWVAQEEWSDPVLKGNEQIRTRTHFQVVRYIVVEVKVQVDVSARAIIDPEIPEPHDWAPDPISLRYDGLRWHHHAGGYGEQVYLTDPTPITI